MECFGPRAGTQHVSLLPPIRRYFRLLERQIQRPLSNSGHLAGDGSSAALEDDGVDRGANCTSETTFAAPFVHRTYGLCHELAAFGRGFRLCGDFVHAVPSLIVWQQT